MVGITLTIHKREIEFIFGLEFMGNVLEELDLSIDEIVAKLDKNPFRMIPTLMFISAESSFRRDNKVIDFSKSELIDWIDESGGLGQEAVVKFLKTFTSSLTKNVPSMKEEDVDDSKKK